MVRIFQGISSIVEDLIKDLNLKGPDHVHVHVHGICCQVFIDTVNQPLLTLDRHLNRHLIDISYYSWSPLDQHVDQHLIDSRLTPMH